MNQPTSKIDYHTKLLIFVITSAFLLRVWGIWNATSTDEYNEVFEALRVCSGNLNYERWFKRFYLYILAIEYGIYYVINWIFGVFQSPSDFAVKIVRDMEPLFLMGRMTSVLLGTSSVFMTYMVGKVLFNRTAGLLAALFLCLNVVNIELSHYARVDASLCFLTLTTFYFIALICKNREHAKVKWYVLAGIFYGCAFQNKPQAVVLIVPFAYAHFSNYQIRDLAKVLLNKKIFHFCWAAILGFLIGNPAVLFAPHKFIASLLDLEKVYTTAVNFRKNEHIGFIAYGIYFFKELGVLLTCLAGYSLIKTIFSRKREIILLFCFMIPFYLLMGASQYMVSFSYMIPFMPFLYLMIAVCLQQIVAGLVSTKKAPVALSVITLCLLIQPLYNVIKFEISMTGANTRILSKKWIEENIPFDSKILMDSGKTINSSAPQIAMNAKSINRLLNAKKDGLKEGTLNDTTKMVDEKSLVYFEMLLKTIPKESYDITSTGFGLNVRPLAYYIENKFQYFVISESMKHSRTDSFFASQHPQIAHFYRSLDNDKRVKLIHTITPSIKNSGGSLYIYKLEENLRNQ